jgi:hypothetical protein
MRSVSSPGSNLGNDIGYTFMLALMILLTCVVDTENTSNKISIPNVDDAVANKDKHAESDSGSFRHALSSSRAFCLQHLTASLLAALSRSRCSLISHLQSRRL